MLPRIRRSHNNLDRTLAGALLNRGMIFKMCDRLFKSQQSERLLKLYREVLHQGEVAATNSPEEKELVLSGLVVEKKGILSVQNRIYRAIFI